MQVTRSSEVADDRMEPANFSGPVTSRYLGAYDVLDGNVLLVSFPAGVRTAWHSHPAASSYSSPAAVAASAPAMARSPMLASGTWCTRHPARSTGMVVPRTPA
jgi:hypothetical protein